MYGACLSMLLLLLLSAWWESQVVGKWGCSWRWGESVMLHSVLEVILYRPVLFMSKSEGVIARHLPLWALSHVSCAVRWILTFSNQFSKFDTEYRLPFKMGWTFCNGFILQSSSITMNGQSLIDLVFLSYSLSFSFLHTWVWNSLAGKLFLWFKLLVILTETFVCLFLLLAFCLWQTAGNRHSQLISVLENNALLPLSGHQFKLQEKVL